DRDKGKDMRRKVSRFALCAMVFALCSSVEAQQPAKVARIGVMVTGERGLELLRQGLRERGYFEGKNIQIVHRYVQGNTDRMPSLVAEVLQNKVDVLIVSNTTAIRAAQNATRTIPIVMMTNQDPVAIGLVESLARPGGNLTGVVSLTRDLSGKRLELLKEAVPKTSRVGVIWVTPTTLGAGNAFKNFEPAASALKLRLTSLQAQRPKPDLDGLFREAEKARVTALISVTNAVFNQHIKKIADFAIQKRMPLIVEGGNFVEEGGMISYAANDADRFLRAAVYVDKILKGARPAELPVEQAMKFEFVINLKTAKQIGVTIPPNVLARADKVIK
ncbi:MAG TPA: ABC transporter substrate-binding protein, partial [Candidatus Binatia bacterium]|nr:ABC transporter substrate-binding protein [Candidatus Binatia bacterium]